MMNHLTEQQIQEYLDNIIPERNQETEAHLAECRKCREELKFYRSLYAELSDDSVMCLGPDFADSVMREVEAQPAVKPKFNFWSIILGVLTAAALIFVLTQYVDLSAMSRSTIHTLVPNISLQPGQLESWERPAIDAVEKYKTYIFLAIILFFTFLMDQFVFSKYFNKKRIIVLFFNGL